MVKFVNDILVKTEELVETIKNSDNFKKYKELKNELSKDSRIMNLIEEVKQLQKKIVKEKSKGNDITFIQNELNNKIDALESYPIYLEYNDLQSELNIQMQVIKDSIEIAINKITN